MFLKGGKPEVNLCLSVLANAKSARSEMWEDFEAQYLGKRGSSNYNPWAIAEWVGEWWARDLQTKEGD